jgi:hypothetical protein
MSSCCATAKTSGLASNKTGRLLNLDRLVTLTFSVWAIKFSAPSLQMAEAIALIGFVSSVITLVQFTEELVGRVTDFQSAVKETPKAFQQVKTELPVLKAILQKTKDAIDRGDIRETAAADLTPVVKGCEAEIKSLNDILDKVLPKKDASQAERAKKAVFSIFKDGKVQKSIEKLRINIDRLTSYHITAVALRPWKSEHLHVILNVSLLTNQAQRRDYPWRAYVTVCRTLMMHLSTPTTSNTSPFASPTPDSTFFDMYTTGLTGGMKNAPSG